MEAVIKRLSRMRTHWGLPILALLTSYLGLRVVFHQWEATKQCFVYPVGYLVKLFYGQGVYTGLEWRFSVGEVPFTLSTQCSGTTFFSLLTAFILYKATQRPYWLRYLLLAYPLALFANSARIISVILTHKVLGHLHAEHLSDAAHVLVGAVTFLSFFLFFVLVVELHHKPHTKEAL